ncbi:MAG: TRAP transporter large permease subunit, partial [Propioniciclava sp.]
ALVVILAGRLVKPTALAGIFYRAGVVSGAILVVIAFTSIFNKVLTLMQIPQSIATFTVGLTDNPLLFLLFVNVLLLGVGMFMETNAAVLLMAPLLFPTAMEFGIDPVHFGIILVTNIEIGLITPPMAANIFVSVKTNRSSLAELLPYQVRFLGAAVVSLLLITYVPALSLWWQ